MQPQHLERGLRAALRTPATRRRLGELHHRRVHPRFEHVVGRAQPRIFAGVFQIRAIAADRRRDRLAGFRMRADRARQRQQLQRPCQIEFADILGDRRHLARLALADLDIGSEPPGFALHRQPGLGIVAERFRPRVGAFLIPTRLAEAAGIFALGIIGARDECPKLAAAQRKLARAALWTQPRIAAIGHWRKQIRREEFIELGCNFGWLLFHYLGGARLEIAPERLQHRLPFSPPAGYLVELVLKPRGEVVTHIALEKALKERRHQPPRFLGEEAVLLDPNVFAVLQRLDDRGIGRWTPNPELFQALDQRCFRKTRRRLREMLFGRDALLGRRIALAQPRQAARILVLRVVRTFFVEREIAGKQHDLPGRAQAGLARSVEHLDRGTLHPRRRHLARQSTLPDQIVQPRMVTATGLVLAEIGWADRFMRFLRILRLGLINAWLVGDVARIIAVRDGEPRGGNRARIHLHAVGAHIGDRAVLIKALRDPHRVIGREPELPRRLLLQR